MRWLFRLALLLAIASVFSTQANATVVDVDLNKTGFTEVPFNPGCYCNAFRHPRRHAFRAGNAVIMRVSLNSRYSRAAYAADIVDVAKIVDLAIFRNPSFGSFQQFASKT
jgi:hypothetical protein